jgi:pimeloyl-ACP methyl ester carboxylesterase
MMRARIVTVPVSWGNVKELNALEVESESDPDGSVLLFLHGMGEAGSSPNELPKVCIHHTPPFQAILGHLPGTLVIAPQSPPIPSVENWNWQEYVDDLARFLSKRYEKRRILATGFSRGGLGVLQLISAHPDLVQEWAVVDPQPARDQAEADAILQNPLMGPKGWVRYGVFRHRSEIWKSFSSQLFERLPKANGDTTELSHVDLAVEAYYGFALSADAGKKNLYEHLGLEFKIDHSTARTR